MVADSFADCRRLVLEVGFFLAVVVVVAAPAASEVVEASATFLTLLVFTVGGVGAELLAERGRFFAATLEVVGGFEVLEIWLSNRLASA